MCHLSLHQISSVYSLTETNEKKKFIPNAQSSYQQFGRNTDIIDNSPSKLYQTYLNELYVFIFQQLLVWYLVFVQAQVTIMIKTARRIGNLRPNPNFNLLPPFLLRQFIEERCFETGDSEQYLLVCMFSSFEVARSAIIHRQICFRKFTQRYILHYALYMEKKKQESFLTFL